MIEVLLKDCGIWVQVYSDDGLTREDLNKVAHEYGLNSNSSEQVELPNFTRVDCAKIAAVRFR